MINPELDTEFVDISILADPELLSFGISKDSDVEEGDCFAQIFERRNQIPHSLGKVRFQIAPADHPLLGLEVDQDDRPLGDRGDACYDRSFKLQ